MSRKHLYPVSKVINALRAKRAGEAHGKALKRLADLYGEQREIFDWLEPAVKRAQDNMPMNDIHHRFAAFRLYKSQFELLTSIYFESISNFKRELFAWAALYSESYPSINSILITKMAVAVNLFCDQIKEAMPCKPELLLKLQPNDDDDGDDYGDLKEARWQQLNAEIVADFNDLLKSVGDCYSAAILKDLADCRKKGASALERFRVQAQANLTYVEEKTKIEAIQIEAFNVRISNLQDEAVQAIRANNEVKAGDALARKISCEYSKKRYEDEVQGLLRMRSVLIEILAMTNTSGEAR